MRASISRAVAGSSQAGCSDARVAACGGGDEPLRAVLVEHLAVRRLGEDAVDADTEVTRAGRCPRR